MVDVDELPHTGIQVTAHPSILVLNAGSSSIKFSIFRLDREGLHLDAKGQMEGIGTAPRLSATDSHGVPLANAQGKHAEVSTHAQALQHILGLLRSHFGALELAGVGHRVVHGGAAYTAPVQLTPAILDTLQALIPLAPLHQPHNLAAIRAVAQENPSLPQVACFDTAFHREGPELSEMLGLPMQYFRRGIRRYGFHGLSYEYIAARLRETAPEIAHGRVIVAHLGNGASLCALSQGRSVATTMGFSTLDGLAMGTRCGSLDPGVILYLMQQERMDASALEDLMYRRSGLLGLSGISQDMRVLLESSAEDAKRAVDYFIYRANREIGSLAAALGGLDALVLTGGIGENSAEIRRRICEGASWLGVALDAAANQRGAALLTLPESPVSAWRLPTNEELMIAQHTRTLLGF